MTNKFVWDQKYSVGIPMFDQQHKKFFDIVNAIIEAAEIGNNSAEKSLELLLELGNYTVYHLKSEEELFDELGYADKETHKASHDVFRKKVSEMTEEVRDSGITSSDEILKIADFAKNWLVEHILVTDKQYTEFFQLNL